MTNVNLNTGKGLTIIVACGEDALGDMTGYDADASCRKYAEVVTAEILKAYPEADVETTFEPQTFGVRVYGIPNYEDGSGLRDESEVAEQVQRITEEVFSDGNLWAVDAQ